ncbi:DUF6809 family protein [Dehalobacter sp. TeCB1]|uniref:DUF6809 family protein n=1 Tax=Dehalobacter sp. TeCB1 TaxID=1843715 RepID=UPI00083B1C26|nr:DUF6809 family protein [Dehalobacter sp. TeCB1]OCZ54279.1 hypothetical protein A7D23_05790 [Dehalobacter sp. TeCB1]
MSILTLIKNHEEDINQMIQNEAEYHKYMDEAGDAWEELIKTGISQEQKDLIESIERASGCIGSIHSEISYQKGFRDAVKLIIESLVS